MQDYIARSRSNPVFQDPDPFQNWFCPEALQLNTQIKKTFGRESWNLLFWYNRTLPTHVQAQSQMGQGGVG